MMNPCLMNDLSLKLLIDVLTIERHWCNSQQLTGWTTEVISDFVLINITTFILLFRTLFVHSSFHANEKQRVAINTAIHSLKAGCNVFFDEQRVTS